MASWNPLGSTWTALTSQFSPSNYPKIANAVAGYLKQGKTCVKRIYLVTWNVHGCNPPADLSDLLSLYDRPLPDIYAIGLQETGYGDWETAFFNVLRYYNYIKVKSRRLQGIWTILFVKRSHLPFVSSIESEVTKTGFKGFLGNKGAASIRLDFMGMNIIFVNSHLAAHLEGLKERIINIDSILDGQRFRDEDTDNIMDHDYIFWMGDLNFRLENTSYNRAVDLICDKDYDGLFQNDQLRLVKEEGLVFEDFHEGELNFPPTYKFDVGTDTYDSSSQQRIPSYTDRILFYFHDTKYEELSLLAKSVHYRCHPKYRISDHKPVSAIIDINVMSKGITSPITFDISTEPWNKFAVNEVEYLVKKGFTTSAWDWIGLYKTDFVDLSSHLAYIWTNSNYTVSEESSITSVRMKAQFSNVQLVDLEEGRYLLCYFSRKGSLCGISKSFVIAGSTQA